jgi:hypothetical protein
MKRVIQSKIARVKSALSLLATSFLLYGQGYVIEDDPEVKSDSSQITKVPAAINSDTNPDYSTIKPYSRDSDPDYKTPKPYNSNSSNTVPWPDNRAGNTDYSTPNAIIPIPYSHFYLGPQGGFNLSGMFGSGIDQMELRHVAEWSGNLGLVFGYKPWRFLAVETGAYITGKGYGGKEDIYIEGYTYTLQHEQRHGFFEFPLILKPTYTFPSQTVFYGLAGLTYARKFSARYTMDVIYDDEYGSQKREEVFDENLWENGIAFPTDTMGGAIIVPYQDLYRVNDASFVFGLGWETAGAGYAKHFSFVVEFKYFISLIDNSYITANGRRLIAQAATEFNQFLVDNGLTYEDVGIVDDGTYVADPVNKYRTFTFSLGFKYYF